MPGSPINKCVILRLRFRGVELTGSTVQDRTLPVDGGGSKGRISLGPTRSGHSCQVRGGVVEAVQPCGGVHEADEVDGGQVRSF